MTTTSKNLPHDLLFSVGSIGDWAGYEQEVVRELVNLLIQRVREEHGVTIVPASNEMYFEIDPNTKEVTEKVEDFLQLESTEILDSVDMAWDNICGNPENYLSDELLIKISQQPSLKQEVYDTKKELGIPNHEALEIVAKRHGYSNWHELSKLSKKLKTKSDPWEDLAKEMEMDCSPEAGVLDGELIYVDVGQMDETSYAEMEKDLKDYEIEGNGYLIHGWNDSSGYAYWANQAEEDPEGSEGWNYIQLTVCFNSKEIPANLDKVKLKSDIEDATSHFNEWSNR